ncbi:MAG: hypothetical protein WD266_08865 [Balneolales bacterium]
MKKSPVYFRYPPNLNTLDLANVISLYRSRGEPADAPAGDFFGCAATFKLIKKSKTWFGLHYSQPAWDALLTKGSLGYPLTEVELNVLGMAHDGSAAGSTRSYIENNCGTMAQLAFLIVNDLKQFDFLKEDESGVLTLSESGEAALQGVSQRLFEKRFHPDMLLVNRNENPVIIRAQRQESTNQRDLF